MSSDCLFCKIIAHQIPSQIVFENEDVLGFKDIAPMAKEHFLFIHKKHTSNINEIADDHPEQLTHVFQAISSFTKKSSFIHNGFRVVTNLGSDAGQSVFHTHFHVLAGGRLGSFGASGGSSHES